MFSTMSIVTQETLSRVTRYALAVLLLTSVHHAYGAFAYNTPWRLHAVFLSAFAAAVIIGSKVALNEMLMRPSVKSRSGCSPRRCSWFRWPSSDYSKVRTITRSKMRSTSLARLRR